MARCEECNRDFSSDEGLSQHRRDVHGEGKTSKHELKKMKKEERILQERKDMKKREKKTKTKKIAIIAVVILALIGAGLLLPSTGNITGEDGERKLPVVGVVGSTHTHQGLKVYLDGVPVDFSQPQYQVRSRAAHFEGGDGNTLHTHAVGVSLGFLFNTLGMSFDPNCFILDNGDEFCNNGEKTLKFFVNGQQNDEFQYYQTRESDHILISYGDESEEEIKQQLDSVVFSAGA